MNRRRSRRSFLKQITAAGVVAPFLAPSAVRASAAETLNLAHVGVGGKGKVDMLSSSQGHNVVALCDIDTRRLGEAAKLFPQAKTYTDWRQLLEQKDIDALTISTPDHTHAPVTMTAMRLGKHVYTQKPLTHSVYEARRLTEAAAEFGVVTQMGTQHHSTAGMKTAVQVVQEGAIGKVREVHCWTDRPGRFWKQGLDRPQHADAVPRHVHWDQWLGTAPSRPYAEGFYHPFHWRGWWDFGTGALGDMGCHILDPVVGALTLGSPTTISAEGPPPHPESGPLWCIVRYEFPGTPYTTDTVKLTWYEAGRQPPLELFKAPKDWRPADNGMLFVGAGGNLYVGVMLMPELLPKGEFTDYKMPQLRNTNHYKNWTDAILGRDTTVCPFSFSGPLTETVLLGNVAYRSGRTILWQSKHLKARGAPEADALIKPPYRKGWQAEGLA